MFPHSLADFAHRLAPKPPPFFRVRGLCKTHGSGRLSVEALRHASFDIFAGSTAITGPNGSGKSTLLSLLGGLDTATRGDIFFRGESLPHHRSSDLFAYRLRMAFVLQDLNLFADQTARDNVAFALTRLGVSRRLARRLAQEELERLEIDSRAARRCPAQLSGGQRQRVAIARALLAATRGTAEVILADEPTASVDSADARNIFETLLILARDQGTPVIIVTHNPDFAQMTDSILHCEDGTVSSVFTGRSTLRSCPDPVPTYVSRHARPHA